MASDGPGLSLGSFWAGIGPMLSLRALGGWWDKPRNEAEEWLR